MNIHEIKSLLCKAKSILKSNDIIHFALESEIIIANAIGLSERADLLFLLNSHTSSHCNIDHITETVDQTSEANTQLNSILYNLFSMQSHSIEQDVLAKIERRGLGEPLAYVLGYKEFWSLSFSVSPSVLIPRPETEMLVEIGFDYINRNHMHRKNNIADTKYNDFNNNNTIKILDLGTGSGCILLSLLKELEQYRYSNIYGVGADISLHALNIACQNAHKHNLYDKVQFVQSDWLSNIQGEFDLIVCNPPYIAKHELNDITVHLHEPLIALTDDSDGMECYRRILCNAQNHLTKNGMIIFEHGYQQENLLKELILSFHYKKITCYKDLAGLPRVITAQL